MKGYNIKEVFLGTKSHKSYLTYATDVSKLAKMGEQVGVTIIQEAVKYHRIDNVWSIKT
jgi:N-acetylglucosamine kinase-like BadF-type ATPase